MMVDGLKKHHFLVYLIHTVAHMYLDLAATTVPSTCSYFIQYTTNNSSRSNMDISPFCLLLKTLILWIGMLSRVVSMNKMSTFWRCTLIHLLLQTQMLHVAHVITQFILNVFLLGCANLADSNIHRCVFGVPVRNKTKRNTEMLVSANGQQTHQQGSFGLSSGIIIIISW